MLNNMKKRANGFSKWGWNIAKIFLAISLLYIAISKTNYQQLLSLKESISWQWILALFILFISMSLLKAFQYHIRINHKYAYWNILKVVIWQNAISNFIATSAGIASYMTMLKTEQNIKLTRSGVTFLITKFGDLLAIGFYLGLSATFVWKQIQPLQWITALVIIAMLLTSAAFLITVLWRERFVSQIERILAWLKLERIPLVQKGLEILYSLAQEEQAPILNMLHKGTILSVIYMTITMFFSYASMKVFNVPINFWAIIYVSAMIQIISYIPIQVFGGLGVSEVTSVYLYNFFGFIEAEMAAVMIGFRAIFYLMNIAILLYLPINTLIQRYNKSYANKQNPPR